GVPVIASDLESIREFVHDGETGLLMPVDDSSALAAATLCLLTNGSRRQSITDRALDFVRRDGDMQRQMAKVATYYDELLRN
ncbi:MAG: glycosyltransferase, partial [Chloroflexota bacterium]